MVFLKKMQDMFSQKKYSELIAFCKEQMEFYPDDVDILFNYASALEATGRYAEARNAFAKLFRITNERLYLICETLPDFMEGKEKEAVAALEKEISEDDKVESLFFAFEVAAKNGEPKVAKKALTKALQIDTKKTTQLLQELFEKAKVSMEERLLLVTVIELLKSLEKKKPE